MSTGHVSHVTSDITITKMYNIYSLHKTVYQAFCRKCWTRKRSSAITLPWQRRDYWRLVCFLWCLYRTLWDSYVSLWGYPTRRETTKNGYLRRRKVTMWDSVHLSGGWCIGIENSEDDKELFNVGRSLRVRSFISYLEDLKFHSRFNWKPMLRLV